MATGLTSLEAAYGRHVADALKASGGVLWTDLHMHGASAFGKGWSERFPDESELASWVGENEAAISAMIGPLVSLRDEGSFVSLDEPPPSVAREMIGKALAGSSDGFLTDLALRSVPEKGESRSPLARSDWTGKSDRNQGRTYSPQGRLRPDGDAGPVIKDVFDENEIYHIAEAVILDAEKALEAKNPPDDRDRMKAALRMADAVNEVRKLISEEEAASMVKRLGLERHGVALKGGVVTVDGKRFEGEEVIGEKAFHGNRDREPRVPASGEKSLSSLQEKLNPRRFPNMSGKMGAILGYVLGKKWTDPEIAEMTVTSDGYVLARHADDIGMNDFMGPVSDFKRNFERLQEAAGLTRDESGELARLVTERIGSAAAPKVAGLPPGASTGGIFDRGDGSTKMDMPMGETTPETPERMEPGGMADDADELGPSGSYQFAVYLQGTNEPAGDAQLEVKTTDEDEILAAFVASGVVPSASALRLEDVGETGIIDVMDADGKLVATLVPDEFPSPLGGQESTATETPDAESTMEDKASYALRSVPPGDYTVEALFEEAIKVLGEEVLAPGMQADFREALYSVITGEGYEFDPESDTITVEESKPGEMSGKTAEDTGYPGKRAQAPEEGTATPVSTEPGPAPETSPPEPESAELEVKPGDFLVVVLGGESALPALRSGDASVQGYMVAYAGEEGGKLSGIVQQSVGVSDIGPGDTISFDVSEIVQYIAQEVDAQDVIENNRDLPALKDRSRITVALDRGCYPFADGECVPLKPATADLIREYLSTLTSVAPEGGEAPAAQEAAPSPENPGTA